MREEKRKAGFSGKEEGKRYNEIQKEMKNRRFQIENGGFSCHFKFKLLLGDSAYWTSICTSTTL